MEKNKNKLWSAIWNYASHLLTCLIHVHYLPND